MRSLEDEAGIIGGEIVRFASHHNLPDELFSFPDHLVIRAADIGSFGKLFREKIAPRSKEAICTETDPRIKVAARLMGSIAIYHLGPVDWTEVDEPRVGQLESTIQRTEFYSESLEKTRTILRARGIPSSLKTDDYKAYVGVEVPASQLEFSFTNQPMSEVVKLRLEDNRAFRIGLGKKADSPESEE